MTAQQGDTEGWGDYTIQAESQAIFEQLVNDPRLNLPEEIKGLASTIEFVGEEKHPFFPVPYKCAEAQAGLLGYIGLLANAISRDRYQVEQRVEVDVPQALLNGLSALFVRMDGDFLTFSDRMMNAVKRWDHGNTREIYRQLATNIYRTKDDNWYALHGNMDPTPLLTMLSKSQHNEQNLSWTEILDMYSECISKFDSKTLDDWSNNVYRLPGTICYEKDEFDRTPHGKAIKDEPYYNLIRQPWYNQTQVAWPTNSSTDRRPLSGIKVLDLARAIAAPTIGRVCAALGATVIRVSCSKNTELPITLFDGCLGKISVDINLKTYEGRKKLLELIQDADVFVDGYRPAVLEHLGFGKDAVLGLVSEREKGIIYCQENCYGWKGPWSTRPGWAQISDSVCGIARDIGRFHGFDEPHIFPGPNADYLTGHAGVAGVLHGLYQRAKVGGSYVVQCSLLVSDLQLRSYGQYSPQQQEMLKRRNKSVIGKVRHYDEIVGLGVKRIAPLGFQADRTEDKAYPKTYYEQVDGSPWGYNPLQVVSVALRFSESRTDFPIGCAPPGYHLPQWTVQKNPDFVPIAPYSEQTQKDGQNGWN